MHSKVLFTAINLNWSECLSQTSMQSPSNLNKFHYNQAFPAADLNTEAHQCITVIFQTLLGSVIRHPTYKVFFASNIPKIHCDKKSANKQIRRLLDPFITVHVMRDKCKSSPRQEPPKDLTFGSFFQLSRNFLFESHPRAETKDFRNSFQGETLEMFI